MSSTWFYAESIPRPKDSPFTEARDFIPDFLYQDKRTDLDAWFELWQNGVYQGWVRLDKDRRTLEFGEPAA